MQGNFNDHELSSSDCSLLRMNSISHRSFFGSMINSLIDFFLGVFHRAHLHLSEYITHSFSSLYSHVRYAIEFSFLRDQHGMRVVTDDVLMYLGRYTFLSWISN